MAKEKVITKSIPTTIVMCHLVIVNKESGDVTTAKTAVEILGNNYTNDSARQAVIPLLEIHNPKLDKVVTSVEIISNDWTLRAMPLTKFLENSTVIRRAATYEDLRATTGGVDNE